MRRRDEKPVTNRGARRGRSGPYAARRRLMLGALLAAALVVLGRAFVVQVVDGREWAARARDQQSQRLALPAPRGTIYDRDGVPLASSRDAFKVALAPREVADRKQAEDRLVDVLGMGRSDARRVLSGKRRWVPLRGEYDAVAKDALDGMSGFYFERVQRRYYPHGELATALLGKVDAQGRGASGLELELDSLLSGKAGAAVVRRDARGTSLPGAMLVVNEPVTGEDVYLTIDHELQEIAHDGLLEALRVNGAAGGDMIIADPATGEILAAASERPDGDTWTGAMEPYEPGSTLKAFLVSSLLAERRATLEDTVFAEFGRYEHDGRVITDTHESGWLSVRDALRVSSNIAMSKLAGRLQPAEQYRYLRDFGFGTLTGVSYPTESPGLLRRPDDWTAYSSASLAMGYEVSVTPLQMVLAYGALANGGILMEPRLVREVRARDGSVLERREPRPVRRVIPRSVADRLRSALIDVVEDGTGQQASMSAFRMAGKTGTARAFRNGRYEVGSYTASFAGFFPADDPQLVILVKLDRPQSSIYGGSTAAPLTRSTLEAALAARGTAIDAGAVARVERLGEGETRSRRPHVSLAQSIPTPSAGDARPPAAGPFILAVSGGGESGAEVSPTRRAVPDVIGLSLRDAAAALHRHGLRVEVDGYGSVMSMTPAAGTVVAAGAIVEVEGRGGSAAPGRQSGVVLARSSARSQK